LTILYHSNRQYGLFFATENTDIHGKITKKYPKEFFFVFEFFRVFLCIPWLKNISFDTLGYYIMPGFVVHEWGEPFLSEEMRIGGRR